MTAFLIAIQFLTRIPVFVEVDWKGEAMGKSVLYYPLIGLLIGLLLALLFAVIEQQHSMLVAAIVLLGWVLITGGLHLDGLADSADAWAGGLGDQQRTLDIMKDSRSGALAIVVLVVVLLLKFAALVAAVDSNNWLLLIVAPVLGRTAALALLLTTPYVRANGLGSDMAEHLPRTMAYGVLLITLLCLLYVLHWVLVLWLLAACALVFGWLRWLMLKRIDGMTGDTAGAMIEIIEVVTLVVMVIQ